jgi:RNA polymerase sigma factor (TIGR02999 family)
MSEVTRMLQAVENGDPKAAEELLPIVYEELRQLAQHRMAHEKPGQTLQATALVHEAYLRLVREEDRQWHGARHFFFAAAQAMQRILIDRARRRAAEVHGGGLQRVPLEMVEVATEVDDATLLLVEEALSKLAQEDPPSAELVQLRFFAGLTNAQAAQALGISERTAKRLWAFARAWLFDELRRPSAS